MTTETATAEPELSFAEYKAQRTSPPAETTSDPVEEVKAEMPPVEEVKTEEEKPAKKPKLEQRFSELTQQRKQAEERAAAAEARARELEEKLKAPQEKKAPVFDPDIGPKPNPSEYQDAFKYAEDLAEWNVKAALKERDQKEAKAREESQRAQVAKAWQERLAAAKAEIPDFDDMVTSSQAVFSDIVRDTIIESEYGPKLLYHFASDDEAAQKLNGMTVKQALMHIAKLEAKYEAQAEKQTEATQEKPKPKEKPPAPITPVKGNSSNVNPVSSPGEFTGTYAQWKAARMAGRI